MIATLVSLALAIGGMAGKDINPSLPDSLGEPAVYLSGDTTGFSNYADIAIDTLYCTTFSTKADVDYYRFVPASSGIYTFSAMDGMNITVSLYGYTASPSPTLLGTYLVNSNENNFGYNHGFYLDLNSYSAFFYTAKSLTNVSNQAYFLGVEYLQPKNSNGIDVFKYQVSSKEYTSLSFESTGSGNTATSGYNPSGSGAISLPNQSPGANVALISGGSINTLNTYPYSCVAAKGSNHTSTAFLMGPNIVATAAHCVSDSQRILPSLGSVSLMFGANTYSSYSYCASYTTIYYSPYYFSSTGTDATYDWAYGVLDDSYGNSIGYLPIAKANSFTLTTSSKLVIDGYKNAYSYQTLSYSTFLNYSGTKLRYTHNTAGGNSGSPVFLFDAGKAIAIHTGSGASLDFSQGIYFDTYKFALAEYLISGGSL